MPGAGASPSPSTSPVVQTWRVRTWMLQPLVPAGRAGEPLWPWLPAHGVVGSWLCLSPGTPVPAGCRRFCSSSCCGRSALSQGTRAGGPRVARSRAPDAHRLCPPCTLGEGILAKQRRVRGCSPSPGAGAHRPATVTTIPVARPPPRGLLRSWPPLVATAAVGCREHPRSQTVLAARWLLPCSRERGRQPQALFPQPPRWGPVGR